MDKPNRLQCSTILGEVIQIYNATHKVEPISIEQMIDVIDVILDYVYESDGLSNIENIYNVRYI